MNGQGGLDAADLFMTEIKGLWPVARSAGTHCSSKARGAATAQSSLHSKY